MKLPSLTSMVAELEELWADSEITPENREATFEDWRVLAAASRRLADLVQDIDQRIAATFNNVTDPETGITTHERVILGGEVYEAKRSASRTGWDKDLLRAVLDSKAPADPDTGEIPDETPLDKVLAVWNLGAPRTTILEDRGIDPDEWATTVWKPAKLVKQVRS